MKIRYILKHFVFRFFRAFYHARKFFSVFGMCLMLLVAMLVFGITASAEELPETVAGETSEETVEPSSEETTAPSSEETTAPSSEETTVPSSEETTVPSSEETTVPSSEETTAPSSYNTYGIVIDESDKLDQVVDPDYNDKLRDEYYNKEFISAYSGGDSSQSETDILVEQQTGGVAEGITFMESFVDNLSGFQASFFAFSKVFEQFAVIPGIDFLLFASIGVGLFAFFLNILPSLVSQGSAASRRAEQQKTRSNKKGSGN